MKTSVKASCAAAYSGSSSIASLKAARAELNSFGFPQSGLLRAAWPSAYLAVACELGDRRSVGISWDCAAVQAKSNSNSKNTNRERVKLSSRRTGNNPGNQEREDLSHRQGKGHDCASAFICARRQGLCTHLMCAGTVGTVLRGAFVTLHSSRMVWRRTEVRFEYRLPRGCFEGMPCRFKSHKNRVNFFKGLWVVELHRPAMLGLVVVVEDPKAVGPFAIEVVTVISPSGIDEFSIGSILRGQIESVEDERFSLRVESPSKCLPWSAFPIPVDNIHDVQIARAHNVAY